MPGCSKNIPSLPPLAREIPNRPKKQANEGLLNPLERLVLAQLKYEQDVGQLRQEHLVDLEKIRQQWEEQLLESVQS